MPKYMTFCLVSTTNTYFLMVSHGSWLWEWLSQMIPAQHVLWCCSHTWLQSTEAVSRPHFLADCWPESLVLLHVVLTMGCLSILTKWQPVSPRASDPRERKPKTEGPVFYNWRWMWHTYHHFFRIHWSYRTALLQCGRGIQAGINTRNRAGLTPYALWPPWFTSF